MKDIKFRVWHDEVGEYFYLDLMTVAVSGYGWNGDFNKIASQLKISFVNQLTVDVPDSARFDRHGENIIIEQFTGLKDKNEKPIYEGDIIEAGGYYSNKYEKYIEAYTPIIYNENTCSFESKNGYRKVTTKTVKDIEIIGTIHENPELIK